MIRKIIKIDEEKCNGCGICADACHEGAIGIIDGKAKLLREDYCDGLGDCLPACPTGAITFEEREALAYNEQAVNEAKKKAASPLPCGCPGTKAKAISRTPGNFHNDFIKNKICIVGCPKLDMEDYTEKLAAIISGNDIKSVTVVRMEVPCCGGIENAARQALQKSGKFIPWQIVTISIDGEIIE